MQKWILMFVVTVIFSPALAFSQTKPLGLMHPSPQKIGAKLVTQPSDKKIPSAQVNDWYFQKYEKAKPTIEDFKIDGNFIYSSQKDVKPRSPIMSNELGLDEGALKHLQITDPKARLDMLNDGVLPQISIDPNQILSGVQEVKEDVFENYFLAVSLQVELKDGTEYVAKENDFYIKIYERALDDIYDSRILTEFYCDGEIDSDGRIDCAVADLGILNLSTKRYDVGVYIQGELVALYIQYGFHKFKDGEVVPELLKEMPEEQYETKCFLGAGISENDVSECEDYSSGGFIFRLE